MTSPRTTVLAAIVALTLVACGDDSAAPVDAGHAFDAGDVDASDVDASDVDATHGDDAGTRCTATSCDDGVFCNGEERCTASGCVAGEPVSCDQGLACDEAREECSCEVDEDGDGWCATDDCDDVAPAVHPAQSEVCNGVDDDCDGIVDQGVSQTFYPDVDGDLYGDAGGSPVQACARPEGYVDNDLDCDDTRPSVHPANAELCNEIDDDCDGLVDPDCACTSGDTRACAAPGACAAGTETCVAGVWSACSIAATDETCNEVDDDCDGVVDDGFDTTTDPSNCGACGLVCAPPAAIGACTGGSCTIGMCLAGRVDLDGSAANGCEYRCVVTAADDRMCDLRDNDCDGEVDEDVSHDSDPAHCGRCGNACYFPRAVGSWCSSGVCVMGACEPGFHDVDGSPSNGCERPDTCVTTETCDGVDEDCDGRVDEALPTGASCGTDEGPCVSGTVGCVRGRPVCFGEVPPVDEWCNGLDDDCDGVVDDGC